MVASTIKAVLQSAVKSFKECEYLSPILDAELLLLHAYRLNDINMNKIKLITNYNDVVPQSVYSIYIDFVQQRAEGKPIQYITKVQEFMGLELSISPGVLIPRADTEIIVEKLIELADKDNVISIVDMCTGSGAIALSLAYYLQNAKVTAVDISDAALSCCRQNIAKLKLQDRVEAVKSNLFEELKNKAFINNIDMIVSNPPYIPKGDISNLSISVREYEPSLALDGGLDGLNFYREISRNASTYLKSGGILAFEIGYNQGQDVMNIIKESGSWYDLECYKDLAGLDRCIIAHYK
ncbi:MAG: peptide chain release factor N(5)-glutamine methyltransferase [Lutisporaceae bacterium]